MPENRALARKLNVVVWIITAIVLVLVGMMRRVKIPTDIDFSFLPPLHSTLNALTAIVLIVALYYIKQRNVQAHQKSMYVAIGLSLLFLLSYVTYHFTTDETLFCKEGLIRTVYFIVLISHVVLAAVIFPFILFTFVRAYTGQIARHRKMAKWVWPLWFYVAVSGPIVYLMLRPCY